ncbi:MAG TPA: hypothetical protein VMF58_04680 [Rhizomicrobium sp.]|nr:hypothetical protein [Rhizomicrobium sp.]
MVRKIAAVGLVAMVLSGCATEYSISPAPGAGQQIRYEQGAPTIFSEKRSAAIQVTPLRVTDDMRLAFGVAAFNKSSVPSNFGVENISVEQADGTQDKVFTSGELIHEAKVDAEWKTFAAALAGGLASASSYSTTRGTAYTPVGAVSWSSTSYDPVQAAEIRAETRDNIAGIRASLDRTVGNIHHQALQTTTVNAGDSYGGIVVAAKLSSGQYPQNIALHVNWNGEDHDFRFVVAEGPPTVTRNTESAAGDVAPATSAPATVAAMPTSQARLQYGYTDNSGGSADAGSASAAAPAMSFEQWQKTNKKGAH